jgi:prepilin-type N-terminal cleavage/methylation domain-containing protein
MKASIYRRGLSAKPKRGFTLLELIIAATILSILTLMALPLARLTIQREKEKELRRALWEMRDAIDKYEQAGERGAFQITESSGRTTNGLRQGVFFRARNRVSSTEYW